MSIDEPSGERARQSRRHGYGDDVERAFDDVGSGILAYDLERGGEDEAHKGNGRQGTYVLVRIVVETKVDGLRMQYGAYELALGGVEAGAQYYGAYLLVLVEASLYDLRAAEEYVSTVLLDVELGLVAERLEMSVGGGGAQASAETERGAA